MGLLDTISGIEIAESHRPWPRVLVSGEGWQQAIDHLSAGRFALLGLWADPPTIHMGLFNGADGDAAIVSYACKSGKFPSVGAHHDVLNLTAQARKSGGVFSQQFASVAQRTVRLVGVGPREI